jgi:hypothetical protein
MCSATVNFNDDRGVTAAIVTCSLEVHEDSEWHVSKVKNSDPAALIKWYGRAPAPKADK